jgi:cell division control protein 7
VLEYFKYKPFISFFATFTMTDIKHYLLQLLKAIKQLKDLGIYHRDVKPGNFLYNPDPKQGALIDFGLSELDMDFVGRLQR